MSPAHRLWLHFLHSFALSDHLGDASEAVRGFARQMGLPAPPEDAGLEEWIDWIAGQGVDEGIWSDPAVDASRDHVASAQLADGAPAPAIDVVATPARTGERE